MPQAEYTKILEKERDLYQRLLELGQNDALEPFLQEALALVVEVTGARQGVLEVSGDADEARWAAAHGFSSVEVDEVRSRISSGILAAAIATGETVLTQSALEDSRFGVLESVQGLRIEAVLCAPIRGSLGTGAIYLQGRSDDSPFGDDHRRQVELLAHHLAPQVDRLVLTRTREEEGDHTTELRSRHRLDEIVGRGPAIATALEQAMLAAPLEVNVLITGESGTGKSQLARAIHDNSKRASGPFVELNCSAIPETLLESELFGAAAGAFADARTSRAGLVSAAEGGTLFLDEIAEVPYSAQAKLLRLIQSKDYFRLGSNRPMRANVRILAATNTDLEAAVEAKEFREDLFFRLHVLPVRLPSLSERRGDIPDLARTLLQRCCERNGLGPITLSPAALRWLSTTDWPGNVRQLENDLEAASIRAHGSDASEISVQHLSPNGGRVAPEEPERRSYQDATRQFQRAFLLEALESEDWNVRATAARLGLARQTVYSLIETFKIRRA
ncbi:MAG: sigma-54-dependent Fis family transcriptional regulator [Myxococcota bacterium]|nr:sigma-54-dependent Fis family transcriptional regulator [Myxococcota bacterium]